LGNDGWDEIVVLCPGREDKENHARSAGMSVFEIAVDCVLRKDVSPKDNCKIFLLQKPMMLLEFSI